MAAATKWTDHAYYATVAITEALYRKDDVPAATACIIDAMERLRAALEALTDAEE